ncbi:MAG: hypothetical protein WC497_01295 [Patescibacteria group bacterium]
MKKRRIKEVRREAWRPGKRYAGPSIPDRCVAALRQATRHLDGETASRCYHVNALIDRIRASCP